MNWLIAVVSLFFAVVLGRTLARVVVDRQLAALAVAWNGSLVEGCPRPEIVFRHAGLGARIVAERTPSGGAFTEARFDLRSVNPQGVRFHVVPEDFEAWIAKATGTRDIQTGDAGFDPHFLLQASDETKLLRWLNPPARDTVAALSRLGASPGLSIQVNRFWMLVRKPCALLDPGHLAAFHHLSVLLLEQLLPVLGFQVTDAVTEGVELLPAPDRPLSDVLVCQVCGEEIGGAHVVCRSCATPHHADCWAYAGRCSTYGCGCETSLATGSGNKRDRRGLDLSRRDP